MQSKNIFITGLAAFGLAACGGQSTSGQATPGTAPVDELHEKLRDVSSGNYSLERNHAFLSFKVGHGNGVSSYRVALTDFDADLSFDPAEPETSTLTVTIDPMGVQANYPADYKSTHPDSVYETWNEDIARDAKWLNADEFPEITFTSTRIVRDGDDTGQVTGDLTFLGQTMPVTLDVIYNGHTNVSWFGERDLIGFDATTTIKRSEWGMGAYIPLVGDLVAITFSGEFLQDE